MAGEKEILEKFILNNPDLEKLDGMLSDFNVFETLNLVHAEKRLILYLTVQEKQ